MKKSIEILGLPVISITEGRELGISKTLLIDAKNGAVAALTIEDEDWYRGVKLIPYESIIAIGEDAVTITHSDNILSLEDSGDYERLLIENINVIGTKAITKNGRIQGKVTEIFIGDNGKIEQCEITAPDGSVEMVGADEISIFGKQVMVINNVEYEKKNRPEQLTPAFEPAYESFKAEPVTPVEPTPVEEEPVAPVAPPVEEEPVAPVAPPVEHKPVAPVAPPVEHKPVAPVAPPVEHKPAAPVAPPVEHKTTPAVTMQPSATMTLSEEEQKIASMTQQAEDLKAALQRARANKKPAPTPAPATAQPAQPAQAPTKTPATTSNDQLAQKKQTEKAVDERRRRFLLGKHATKTITADGGTIIVGAGAEITEEVLQRAKLANKFIELSMHVQ